VVPAQHPVLAAHQQDRERPELVLVEVTGLGDLVIEAGQLPDPPPELLFLQPGELLVAVAIDADPLGTRRRTDPAIARSADRRLVDGHSATSTATGSMWRSALNQV
jgi:hypothetical protein